MPVVSRLALSVDERRHTRRLTSLLSLPDAVLLKILRLAYKGPPETNRAIFSVCRRLSSLGKTLTLATLSIRSTPSLVSLLGTSLSPIYHLSLSQHIRTLELFIAPQRHDVIFPRHRPFRLPNLDTVRFRFLQGVPLMTTPSDTLASMLATNALCTQTKAITQWQQFLACLNPRRLEWISPEAHQFHLVGLSTPFIKTIRSWDRLESILLDGICLIEQHDMATWTLGLLAKSVHIRGPFYDVTLAPLYARGRITQVSTSTCTRLVFENVSPSYQPDTQSSHTIENEIPIVSFGETTVILKGIDFSVYQAIVLSLTDKRVWNFLEYRQWRHTNLRETASASAQAPMETDQPRRLALRTRIWKRIKREIKTLWWMMIAWHILRQFVLLGVSHAYPWLWRPTRVALAASTVVMPYDPIQQPVTRDSSSLFWGGRTPAPTPGGGQSYYSW